MLPPPLFRKFHNFVTTVALKTPFKSASRFPPSPFSARAASGIGPTKLMAKGRNTMAWKRPNKMTRANICKHSIRGADQKALCFHGLP